MLGQARCQYRTETGIENCERANDFNGPLLRLVQAMVQLLEMRVLELARAP